ncbi:hypothetical protein SBOR_6673 [Sclerotinia borealis F-4128]|uniref:F-box domain-containing protein n=1 Tax=Sclerotinia borealis (strain F-4128) TaxID=1432307 RepID=W9CDS7_SCLBF|nr:hypothetical protein SBOR_6673 [Sclerotinia borealis F-4128]
MPTNFLSLPRELRNSIYELLLVFEESIRMNNHLTPQKLQDFTPGLLRANKIIHSEASFILYAQNRFTLYDSSESFFEKIGRNNASSILYICIDFPRFDYRILHGTTLRDPSSQLLAKIQSDCTNIQTLQTSLETTVEMEHRFAKFDNFNIGAGALALADAHFRGIASLQDIIVEVYKEGPSALIRKEMESHGWTINTREFVEELDVENGVFMNVKEYYESLDHHEYQRHDDSGF